MKLLLIFSIYFLLNIIRAETIPLREIIPDEKLILKEIKLNKEILLKVDIKNFKQLQKYKIMIHYIGSYAISFKISLVCDDIHFIKEQRNKEDLQLNDFSEFDFQTNTKQVPAQCGDDYDKDIILISIVPYSIGYQFLPENDIQFNIIAELISNKYNSDTKFVNILFNKGLYKGIIFWLVLIIVIFCILGNKLSSILSNILELNERKKNS